MKLHYYPIVFVRYRIILFFLLTKELLKKYIYSASNKTNKRLVAQLAINCLIVSIDYNELHICTFLINEIEKLLDNELNFYEQTVFLYATGYFELKKIIKMD